MNNYKVKVNNEDENWEAQSLFFQLGCCAESFSGYKYPMYLACSEDQTFTDYAADVFLGGYKELKIPQLRDLVVLRRNSINDATHKCGTPSGRLGFLSSDGDEYIWSYPKLRWFKPNESSFNMLKLKPIEKSMSREYINKTTGEYRKTSEVVSGEQWIEVLPQHFFAYQHSEKGYIYFLDKPIATHHRLLWQRPTHPEALPFVDDEPSLNDQYAEIEEVRQDIINKPNHYNGTECLDAMQKMMTHEQFIGFLRGNVFKYQWRYDKKNGLEDLKKSQWYLDKLMSLL